MSIDRVITGGYCVGCGACAVATGGQATLQWTEMGVYRADISRLSPDQLKLASAVCPFSDDAVNEDVLAGAHLQSEMLEHDRRLGYFARDGLYAGRVTDDERVLGSSSGGLTTWLVEQMLVRGLIDAVIHVEPSSAAGKLFEFCETDTVEGLLSRGKSRYYAVEMSALLQRVSTSGKRYAFIGVPCFVKAVRLLQRSNPVLQSHIPYLIGLVCGHMKSSGFAELLAWQAGVLPQRLEKIDFRVKRPDIASNSYHIRATDRLTGENVTRESIEFYGNNWGHAFFQLRSCDFCDDVMAETADVAFGDAWLPQYSKIWQGTNVVICRNAEVQKILLDGLKNKNIYLEALSSDDVAKTQDGNYRHRWDGLSVRLSDAKRQNYWVPLKRILAGSRPVARWRKKLVRLRVRSELRSHTAFAEAKEKGDLQHFMKVMKPITDRIEIQYKLGKLVEGYYFKKLLSRARRMFSTR